jgi:hypothetical protein
MVEHCVFNQIQFTPTHLIAFLKITMLNLVEHCIFIKVQFNPTHLIAVSQTIKHTLVLIHLLNH